jgi:hypothetical protein
MLIAAYAVAMGADFVEICGSPIFGEGFASPFNDFLDVVVCFVLSAMIGFHIAFLPSFLIKMIPVVEIAPTWTLAMLIATRNQLRTTGTDNPKPEVIVEDARPPKIPAEKRD